MHDEGLQVGVSFDPQRGYFTTGSELARSLTALSLGGLRRRIEAQMLPDDPIITLNLDHVEPHSASWPCLSRPSTSCCKERLGCAGQSRA